MTYEYVKNLINQDLYPEEKYCVNVDPLESDEINRIIFKIKMYQDSGDEDKILDMLKEIFEQK